LVAASLGSAAVVAAARVPAPEPLEAGLKGSTDQGLVGFYRTRAYRPMWTAGGTVHPASRALVEILKRAPLDGMETGPAFATRVEAAILKAGSGQAQDLTDAELLLSRSWVDYVRVLRRPVNIGMVYASGAVSPSAPYTAEILGFAAAAPDLGAHLRKVSDLNPLYSQLRAGLAAWQAGDRTSPAGLDQRGGVEQRLRLNLDRARALPIAQDGRFILVDTANARLLLYQDGRVHDSMRVVIGKAVQATPMVAGMLRNAVLNPYWNVPPDLIRTKVAPGVLKQGVGFLKARDYEVLADWSANPAPLDAKTVDWAAVAAGKQEVRVRQLPGGANAMGEMKFNFPNDFGIYLHDTPDKSLFTKADRRLSSGCIRLEDAKRLAKWLFGHVPTTTSMSPEQVVVLAKPVPVYVTYLTASWDGKNYAFANDGYSRDAAIRAPAAAGDGGPSPH